MCGIFGALGCEVSEEALAQVFEALRHRGPDGRGAFADSSRALTLAHTRLAVMDPASGGQPLFDADGSLVLVANGEIYDFERIRSALQAKGHRFRTRSDSEVILALYREHGLDCFEHLRGEFAFLLYDKAKQLLIAARDRFGIKPLYFSRRGDAFVFASEMKALFASGLVDPELDVASLDPFAKEQELYCPFRSVEQVAPGTYMAIDLATASSTVTRYWSPQIPDESARPMTQPFGDAADKAASIVLAELEEAVRLRLRADVPVGLYLSGGLDSVFIGALMARVLETPFRSFSIAFTGSDRNEQAFASRAAGLLGTQHHELAVTREMLWDNLEDALWFSELPFGSLAPVGKFLLSREAGQAVKVVLTGEGADELFLGYRGFFEKAIRDGRSRKGRGASSASLSRLELDGFLAPIARKLSLFVFHRNARPRVERGRGAGLEAPSARPLVNLMQEARIARMPQDILCFLGDREEMAHSLEARLPFLDHHLYDAAKWIPVDLKMRDGVEKAVLRDAARGLVPDDLRLRRKTGFMTTSDPIDIFGEDRRATRRLEQYLSRQTFEESQLFSYGAFRILSFLARLPTPIRFLRRIRRNSNKVIMVMMQMHMLREMFVTDPRWKRSRSSVETPIEYA